MDRKATAIWEGNLKNGKGKVTTESGVLKESQYSFNTRFENGIGTNPEELLAAAHAGCFAMALSNELNNVGIPPKKLEAKATITLDKDSTGFTITKSHIDLVAEIPGTDPSLFETAVKSAEKGCPVSKLFKAEVTITSKLN